MRLRDDRTLQITLGVVGVFVLVAAGLIGYVFGNSGEESTTSSVNGMMSELTGKIALAHLNEFPDYYTRLEAMEERAKRDHGIA